MASRTSPAEDFGAAKLARIAGPASDGVAVDPESTHREAGPARRLGAMVYQGRRGSGIRQPATPERISRDPARRTPMRPCVVEQNYPVQAGSIAEAGRWMADHRVDAALLLRGQCRIRQSRHEASSGLQQGILRRRWRSAMPARSAYLRIPWRSRSRRKSKRKEHFIQIRICQVSGWQCPLPDLLGKAFPAMRCGVEVGRLRPVDNKRVPALFTIPAALAIDFSLLRSRIHRRSRREQVPQNRRMSMLTTAGGDRCRANLQG